jgi:hypothetical protein
VGPCVLISRQYQDNQWFWLARDFECCVLLFQTDQGNTEFTQLSTTVTGIFGPVGMHGMRLQTREEGALSKGKTMVDFIKSGAKRK